VWVTIITSDASQVVWFVLCPQLTTMWVAAAARQDIGWRQPGVVYASRLSSLTAAAWQSRIWLVWSRFRGQADSPHAVASLVYSPRHYAVQGPAIRASGYTVHDDGLLHADRRRRSDYVTAFHLAGRLPFQDSLPCDIWRHVIRLR